MCSIGEDDFGDEGGLHSMIQELTVTEDDMQGICKKCDQVGFVIKLNFREPECSKCFLGYVRHKFRATLGSSKILPKGAKILLLFDGSAESLVLLDMMHYAQTQNNFKRLHCSTRLLYIDDNQLMLEDKIKYKQHVEDIAQFLKQYETFETFITNIGILPTKLTNLNDFDTYLKEMEAQRNEEFFTSVQAMRSLTSQQDFIKYKRNKLLADACNQLNCDFIFVPDISTNLAAELLIDISLGRGGAAALDVSLEDDRLPGAKLIRPLKDLNAMEVKFYLQVQNLKLLKIHNYGENFDSSASLQNLTKAFVENLQKNFSSTVSTVFRTGDKIAPNIPQLIDGENTKLSTCTLCNSKVDYFGSKTLLATEFSRVVSAKGAMLNTCTTLEEIAKNDLYDQDRQKHEVELCHACRTIQNESLNKIFTI